MMFISELIKDKKLNSCEIKDLALKHEILEEDPSICVCEFQDGSKLVLDNGEIVAYDVNLRKFNV